MGRGTPGAKQRPEQGLFHQVRGMTEDTRKMREHEEGIGRKFGGKRPAIMEQQRSALSREKREVLENIRKLLDPRGLMKADPERLRRGMGGEQEMHHLLTLFYNALINGEVRNFRDFERYMAGFLKRTGQDPKYAPTAVTRMVNKITRERRGRLEHEFRNLAAIARGNSPYD